MIEPTAVGTGSTASRQVSDPAVAADWARNVAAAAEASPSPRVVVREDLTEAARAAAADTAHELALALARRGVAHLVLTGGSGGEAVAGLLGPALAADGVVPGAGLEQVHLWFGDERFVPVGHPDRNDVLATALVEAGVPEENVHRVAGPETVTDVRASARALAADLDAAGPADGVLDVVHLGLGPDGHVASLFPGHPDAAATGVTTVAVTDSPKPPPERVSLTFEMIQAARAVMVIAGGRGKAEVVARGLAGPDPVTTPGSCARGARSTTWYLDEAAAAGLPARGNGD